MAISLHYFLLTTFVWSFVAGYQIYVLLVVIFDSSREKSGYSKMSKYKVLGYGIPAIFVIFSFAMDRYLYQGSTYNRDLVSSNQLGCWMSPNEIYLAMFFIPVVLILGTNMCMLGRLLYGYIEADVEKYFIADI